MSTSKSCRQLHRDTLCYMVLLAVYMVSSQSLPLQAAAAWYSEEIYAAFASDKDKNLNRKKQRQALLSKNEKVAEISAGMLLKSTKC